MGGHWLDLTGGRRLWTFKFLKMRGIYCLIYCPGFECWQGKQAFLLSKPYRVALHLPVSRLAVTGFVSWGWSGRRVNLTTHLLLALSWRTSGSVPLLPMAYRGGFNPPPPKFRRPFKIVPNSTQLWKMLKIAEFRTQTPQDVRKKDSKILKLPSVRNCFTLAMTNKCLSS